MDEDFFVLMSRHKNESLFKRQRIIKPSNRIKKQLLEKNIVFYFNSLKIQSKKIDVYLSLKTELWRKLRISSTYKFEFIVYHSSLDLSNQIILNVPGIKR